MLPQDTNILLSYLNTQLRDFYPSFEEFCEDKDVDGREVEEKLSAIGYHYSAEHNRFES